MNKGKLVFALGLLLLTIVAGVYFSGYVTRMLLQQNEGALQWSTYQG